MSADRSTTPEAAKVAIDRLTFFSDAVVAIAMTLLAIDLPVPDAHSREAFFSGVGDHLGQYLAFLISFYVISQYWRGHHRLFRYVTDATGRLVNVNFLWLLTIVLTPFATRVLYGGDKLSDSDFPFRFGFYALVQAAAAATFLLSHAVIERGGILSPSTPARLVPRSRVANVVLAATFSVSIPLAFLVGPWAYVAWSLLPVWVSLGMRLETRRHPEFATSP